MSNKCPTCGSLNSDGTEHCSSCGTQIASKAPSPIAVKKDNAQVAKTMMMGMSPFAEKKKAEAAVKKTQPMTLPKAGVKEAAKPVQKIQKIGQAKTKMDPQKTAFGMPAVIPQTQTKKKEKPAPTPMARFTPSKPPPAAVSNANKTMFGFQAPSANTETHKKEPKKEAPKSQPQEPPKEVSKEPVNAQKKSAPKEPSQALSDTNPGGRKLSYHTGAEQYDDYDEPENVRGVSGKKLVTLLIVITSVLLLIIVVFGIMKFMGGGPKFNTQVFSSPDGKTINVKFNYEESPPGTVLQVAGKTFELVSGQCEVKIEMSKLVVGNNEIEFLYLEPNSNPEKLSFPLVLRHLVSNDFSGLMAEKPYIDVLFQVADNTDLSIEGKGVNLLNKKYTHKVLVNSLPPSSSGNLVHKVPFMLTDKGSGTTDTGQHVIEIPVTKLDIDRPAPNSKVLATMTTCSGKTDEGALVTVNGKSTGVIAGRFNTAVSLEMMGPNTIVIESRLKGKAPSVKKITVTRVENLDDEIKKWSVDIDKSLGYPNLSRDTAAHTNKKLQIAGRIVNINTQNGVTVFLLYVADSCPPGGRCAVYVVFRGETDAGLQSWVNVYGKVAGTRAVDLPGGQKLNVPSVNAEFVLKSKRKKKR